jgi:hypothetical protein
MLKGEAGSSITSIEKTGSVGNVDTYTIHFNDDTPDYSFEVTNGYSIISIEKTATVGNVDTYTVTLDNGDTYTFDVYNANIANSMTASDETTVGPSINAVKNYVYDHTDADGILFCGDFVNVPYSAYKHNKADFLALGWTIPPWLTWVEGKGFHIQKDYATGNYAGLLTPQYREKDSTLADLGINKIVCSVEWSKDGDDTIHTNLLQYYTTAQPGSNFFQLEEGVSFGIGNLYWQYDKGKSNFWVGKDVNTIQGDYYIRKIKIEKGNIATPFGLNKDQFFANSIFRNIPEVFEGAESGTTDAQGYYYQSIEITSVDDLDNIVITGVAVKVGTIDAMVFFSNYSNDNVELEYKLARDGNTRKTYLTVYFHMPSLVNVPVQLRVMYYTLKNPFS